MSVTAVSPQVRDDFLAIWPIRTARYRTATIVDRGRLIPWHRFGTLYVGLAVYSQEDEIALYNEKYWAEVKLKRTWWRCVPELQRFVRGTADT